MTAENDITQTHLWDTLLEVPIEYKVGEREFCLYPPSLGCSLLIKRYSDRIDRAEDMVYYSLAICSFKERSKANKPSVLKERVEQLKKASIEELMPIYTMFVSWGKDQDTFIKFFHLDVEQRYMRRAHDAKDKDNSSLSFNGKSIYGTLLDVVFERYGWSMGYVLWGISLINLNMLMSDKVVSVYMSKEESKRAAIPHNRNINKAENMSKEQLLAFMNR